MAHQLAEAVSRAGGRTTAAEQPRAASTGCDARRRVRCRPSSCWRASLEEHAYHRPPLPQICELAAPPVRPTVLRLRAYFSHDESFALLLHVRPRGGLAAGVEVAVHLSVSSEGGEECSGPAAADRYILEAPPGAPPSAGVEAFVRTLITGGGWSYYWWAGGVGVGQARVARTARLVAALLVPSRLSLRLPACPLPFTAREAYSPSPSRAACVCSRLPPASLKAPAQAERQVSADS